MSDPNIGQERPSSDFAVSSRKIVAEGKDVQVKEFLLGPGEEVPWHHHTEVFDVFYCLEGRLHVQCAEVWSGEARATVELGVGQSLKLEPGTAHRPFNPSARERCRFLLVQGIGEYDWIRYEPRTRSD
ncbi:cupin domain-containing protein [Ramlibacter alkalitolerans]|uniref:Cupin domain-containing protein n=1 Tax=Ramlibacter alkalitolerans TaxID=2039631 RepID=A0ABS1JKK6_9BURK|nr:cupin domain-containing protein [Ramlibacter alkalitolerans]MBL0424763.1 cupin domain-containing protein [Ramlibacter alkalitolerans]